MSIGHCLLKTMTMKEIFRWLRNLIFSVKLSCPALWHIASSSFAIMASRRPPKTLHILMHIPRKCRTCTGSVTLLRDHSTVYLRRLTAHYLNYPLALHRLRLHVSTPLVTLGKPPSGLMAAAATVHSMLLSDRLRQISTTMVMTCQISRKFHRASKHDFHAD